MKKSGYLSDLEHFLSNKIFTWSLTIISAVCYGYSAVNTTISIDDMNGYYHFGRGNSMLSSGRFGMPFWSKVIGFDEAMPPHTFAIEILAVACFCLAAINFCILFKRVSKNRIHQISLNFFALLLVSYPLINEIWEYSGANIIVCIGYLCVSISLLVLQEMRERKKINALQMVGVLMLMILVAAGYESLIVVYIFGVTAVLFLQLSYEDDKTTWKLLGKQILFYVTVLIISIIGRLIIDNLLHWIFELPDIKTGATEILWGSAPFLELVKKLILDLINMYVLRAIIYFPLQELLIAVGIVIIAIIVITIKKRRFMIMLPGIGMLLSLILLSIVQGKVSPYRTCQVFGVFVAFSGLLLMEFVMRFKNLRKILVCFLGLLVIHQAMYLSYFLNLNHIRSEEEIHVLREIGDDLSQYKTDKPVIFVGNYNLSNYVVEASSVKKESREWFWYSVLYSRINHSDMNEVYHNGNRKIVSTNVKSMIQWAAQPENGQKILKKTFQYLGYDYKTIDEPNAFLEAYYVACAQVQEIWDAGKDLDWKNSYAILETEDYIVVHLK